VSLTNTKREAWLSDLANPAVALRRFNRTIPYGINGKGLLEQCLAKEIPTARAIWLAKCIGANELRTLKRKGVGGALGLSAELKWVREWTMHVEQFIDATISTRSDSSWKEKVQYVVRLTYHLYVEHLLDQDHFLDWILASFESSSIERLPLWLVHLQLYWRFLVSTRKRGRRLAEAVCNSLHQIEVDGKNQDLLTPITQRLRLLLGSLAISHTACLVMPKSWAKFEGTLKNLTSRGHLAPAIASTIERNNRLAKPLWEQNPKSTVSPKRRAFDLLDGGGLDPSVPDLCTKLYDLLTSTENVIKLVLEWCSSGYRHGAHRVYLASRILRRFGMSGADVETHVLNFLMEPPATSNIQVSNVIKVVAELVRAKSFAVLKVLRAVIARGAMSDSQHNPQSAERLRQLVKGIPTAGLPQHVGDLQQNLLREATEPGSDKQHAVNALKQFINFTVFDQAPLKWKPQEKELLSSLSVGQKFELSAHIRLQVLRMSQATFSIGSGTVDPNARSLTTHVFAAARDVLEKLEDFPLLADVVGVCLKQSNGEMLAAVIHTIHYQAKTFASIGALRPLTSQAIERYHVFRNEMPLEKIYVQALLNLLKSTSGDSSLIQRLSYDLTRCDQRNALAMCSPASDNALDLAATSSLDTEEEIERILSSGTTMDEQMVTRVFQRITTHLSVQLDASTKPKTKAEWFSRLRAFDEATFDGLASELVAHFLRVATEDKCCFVLPLLMSTGALSFASLAQIDANLRENTVPAHLQCKLSVVMLTIFLFPPRANGNETLDERYSFKLAQADFLRDSVDSVLKQVGFALQVVDDASQMQAMDSLREILLSDEVRDLILQCAIEHKKPLQKHVMSILADQRSGKAGITILKDMIETLLDQQGQMAGEVPNQEKIPRLVRMVGELSLPLCQLEMQLLLHNGSKAAEGSFEMATSLFEAIMRSPDSERPPWLDLVDELDAVLLQRLRAIAEIQVLKIVNDCFMHIKGDGSAVDSTLILKVRSLLRRLLYVVDCTVVGQASAAGNAAQPLPAELESHATDRFAAIREVLTRHFLPETDPKPLTRITYDLTCCLLNGLLHLLVVRKLASDNSASSTAAADVSSILPILLSVFSSPALSTSRGTVEFLYDTAAYLSDDLTDEARSAMMKNEGNRWTSDARITFILGTPSAAADAWLGLVTSNQVPGTPVMTTPGQSQASPARFGPPQPQSRFPQQTPRQTPQQSAAMQRMAAGPNGPLSGAAMGIVPQAKSFNAPVPFHLRRWEMLPDQGSNAANDTAISLSLLGARRV
jgi:mediator of RNA polymerase II transcription subunit 12